LGVTLGVSARRAHFRKLLILHGLANGFLEREPAAGFSPP
jgi:hypothetical protein